MKILIFYFLLLICSILFGCGSNVKIEKCKQAYNNGNSQKALKSCLDVIEEYPNNGKAYYGVGGAYLHLGEYENAVVYSNKAIELGYNNEYGVYFNLGCAYYNLGDYKNSISSLEKVLELGIDKEKNSIKFFTYMYLGLSETILNNYENSLIYLSKAIDLVESDKLVYDEYYGLAIPLYYFRASNNFKLGKNYDDINKDLNLYLSKCGESCELKNTYFMLGNVYQESQKYNEAINYYTKGLSGYNNSTYLSDGIDLMIIGRRGLCYAGLKQYNEAINDFSLVINNLKTNENQDLASAYYARGKAYLQLDNYDEAISDFDKAWNIGNDNLIFLDKGIAYYLKNSFYLALLNLKTYSNYYPNDPVAYFYEGKSYERLSEFKEAKDSYTKALEKNINNDEILFLRGMCSLMIKDWEDAKSDMEEFIYINPNDPDAYYFLGLAIHNIGNETEAIIKKNQAISLDIDRVNYLSESFGR